jgi:hypothetical protein
VSCPRTTTTSPSGWPISLPRSQRSSGPPAAPATLRSRRRCCSAHGRGELDRAREPLLERAVAAALHNTDIGIDYGLTTTIRVQLSADAGAAEHAASRRELQQQIEIEDLRHTQRLRLEATDKDVLRARIELYREIISAGDVEQFALQLARNPDGVETVIRMVREVRKEEHRHVTDFLTTLLESGAIDRWEVKNTVQTALDWLKESNDRFVQAGEVHIPWQRATSYGERNGGGKGSPRGNGTTLTKG